MFDNKRLHRITLKMSGFTVENLVCDQKALAFDGLNMYGSSRTIIVIGNYNDWEAEET